MRSDRSTDLLSLRCEALADAHTSAVADLLDQFDPDAVYVTTRGPDVRVRSRIERAFDGPVLTGPTGNERRRTERFGDVVLTAVDELDVVADTNVVAGRARKPDVTVPPDTTHLVCDAVEPSTDAVRLDASLAGLDALAALQADTPGEFTVLTGALPASYDHVWTATVADEAVRVPVRGLGPLPRSGAPQLPLLTLDTDGRVAVTAVPADRFGLRALSGVGPATADGLRDAGFEDRAAVATAPLDELAAVDGVGGSRARTLSRSARALADGRVVRLTGEAVPPGDREPLYVDIETDGLTPSVIWLVGAYDTARDRYVDFVDDEPSLEDPGVATREFVTWLAAEYDRPALVTWNGHGFDFPHLDRFVAHHAPAFQEYWQESVYRYDLYDWAVRRENAVLPGRTNRLADVAAALGRERESRAAATDGRTLARAVGRLLRSPERAGEIDWDAARAYCEADVRELAAVADAMRTARPRRSSTEDANEPTTQAGLADFSKP